MTTKPETTRLTAASASEALTTASRHVGLETDRAELVRLGENAIFVLPGPGIVARIARSLDLRERVDREVAMASWLEELGFPAIRLAPGLPQVLEADGRLVTFWRKAEELPGNKTLSELGTILRRFHALPPPPFALPAFDPFSMVPTRLAQAEDTVAPADLTYLRERHAELADALSGLTASAPLGLIHGDAHRSNLLKSPSGILLLDFEVLSYGPREWDLVPTALANERFGLTDEEYAEFVTAYGRDVTSWNGYRDMANMRELTMTTWLMQNVGESPQIAKEFTARVQDMRTRDFSRTWLVF